MVGKARSDFCSATVLSFARPEDSWLLVGVYLLLQNIFSFSLNHVSHDSSLALHRVDARLVALATTSTKTSRNRSPHYAYESALIE